MTGPTSDSAPGPAAAIAAASSATPTPALPVQVWVQGAFPVGTGDYARRAITAALSRFAEPVRQTRVRLKAYHDPAVHFPVVAQGNLVLGGRPVRVQVHGATATQAIDLLQDRLRRCVHAQQERAASGAPERISPKPWVASVPRPPQARQIVRSKPVHPAVLGVDEAVAELHRRDYACHLFTESGTRQDSVVHLAGPACYRLIQVLPDPDQLAPYTVALTCYDRPAPRLTVADAAEWLGWSEVPFLFFLDVDRGRGSVLYRRFDGHYGLIWVRTPVWASGRRPSGGGCHDNDHADGGHHRAVSTAAAAEGLGPAASAADY
jgi:hypothetical protein